MINHITIRTLLFLSGLFILSACNNGANEHALLEKSLENTEYPIDLTASGKAKLSDGVFNEQADTGSSINTNVSLHSKKCVG